MALRRVGLGRGMCGEIAGGLGSGVGGAASSLLTDLVAYWPLEAASGTRADATGRGNDLTPNVDDFGNVAGLVGNAVDLTNTSRYLQIASPGADFTLGDVAITVAGWVYLTGIAGGRGFWSRDGGAGNRGLLLITTSGAAWQFAVSPDGTNYVTVTGATATASAWHLLVGWHDPTANTINLQVDNGTVGSTAHSTGIFASSNPVQLGRALGGGRNMLGYQDEWAVWRRVLTADERTALYNAGAGRTYPFT